LFTDVASAAGFTQAGLQLDEHGDVGVVATRHVHPGFWGKKSKFRKLGSLSISIANIKISKQHSYILNTLE
jgi:hypothetical protein